MCEWLFDDILLTLLYAGLLTWSLYQFSNHYRLWSIGQAKGLIWYLVCTSLLCAIRCIGFILPALLGPPRCYTRYRPWQWQVLY